jgi:hypothetical protein
MPLRQAPAFPPVAGGGLFRNHHATIQQLVIGLKSAMAFTRCRWEARLRELRAIDRDNKTRDGANPKLAGGLKISPAAAQ